MSKAGETTINHNQSKAWDKCALAQVTLSLQYDEMKLTKEILKHLRWQPINDNENNCMKKRNEYEV